MPVTIYHCFDVKLISDVLHFFSVLLANLFLTAIDFAHLFTEPHTLFANAI
jgi:hypothetical protein